MLKSTPSVFVLFSEFKKLSAVLNWYAGSFGEYLSPNAFVWYFFTVPYSHSYFGEGVINSVEQEGEDLKLDINFEKAGHKRLMAKFANLEIR